MNKEKELLCMSLDIKGMVEEGVDLEALREEYENTDIHDLWPSVAVFGKGK